MKNVIGLFDSFDEARDVIEDLVDAGFDRNNISMVANDAEGRYARYDADYDDGEDIGDGVATGAGTGAVLGGLAGLLVGLGALTIPGIGPIVAAGPIASALAGAGIGAVAGGLIGALADLGVPDEEAEYYAEGVRRGGVLVTVSTTDDMADRAVAIMNQHGAVDINDRVAYWRQEGWTGWDNDVEPLERDAIIAERDRYTTAFADQDIARTRDFDENLTRDRYRETEVVDDEEAVIPVIEEEMTVGKRAVQRGGVRVYSHVEEVPVTEDVTLTEEKVHVTRRPVDRPVTDADLEAFKDVTIELTETAEEAIVGKQARVVEEVVVDKDVETHTETVRGTVRRTDVDVEDLGTQTRRGTVAVVDFDAYDQDFRRDWQTNFADSGYNYEQLRPAYRYGYTLGTHDMYANRDWDTTFENEIRDRWERENPGTWDTVRPAVRSGWTRVRDADRDRNRNDLIDLDNDPDNNDIL